MKKIKFIPASFNSLKRDPDGAKVQRLWAKDFRGLGMLIWILLRNSSYTAINPPKPANLE